ncbi:MAG: FixH family protein [Anaerolineae bacterium]
MARFVRMNLNLRVRAGLFAACMLLLAACARGGRDLPDVDVALTIEPSPPRVGLATVTVALADATGAPITGADVELEGNMSHAGMVPVFGDAREVAPGRYEADLEFTMGGDWFILVRATLPDGRSLERQVDVPAVDVMCLDTPVP